MSGWREGWTGHWLLDAEPHFFEGMAWYRPLQNGRPPLLCLSGFQDTARTFVFLEEVLDRFDPVFLDWRGQGASDSRPGGIYTIQETFADLLRFTHAQFDRPFHLMGHSMGSALAARFAGLAPAKVLSLVLIEGFSGVLTADEEARRLSEWAERLPERIEPHRVMKSFNDVCRTLAIIHRGVRPDRIRTLAGLLSRPMDPANTESGFVWVHDPALKNRTVPLSFCPDVSRALWQRITAPGILLLGSNSRLHPNRDMRSAARSNHPTDAQAANRLAEIVSHFIHLDVHEIPGAGHNLHHDMPEAVVPLLLDFYRQHGPV